jgi:hypothetical protein
MYDNNFADRPIEEDAYNQYEAALKAADKWTQHVTDIINTVESITLDEVDYHYEAPDTLHIKIPEDLKSQITIILLKEGLISDFTYNYKTSYLTVS